MIDRIWPAECKEIFLLCLFINPILVHFRAFMRGFFENRLEVLCTEDIQGVRNENTQPQRSADMSFKTLFSIYICSEIRELGIIYQCSSVMYIKRTLLPRASISQV
jgi:hypothetical protein